LTELGFEEEIVTALDKIINASSGLFLITGPTGSGKTTTLYSLFRRHLKDRKIMTLEDPVEYVLPPIQQTTIQHAEIFSYHDGLKSILRHDPDIIFVGEIRDRETAELTLRAAMTGHLVCATTHTHAAIDALYRFLDFGISQPALGTQLLGVLAQQLHPSQEVLKLEAELLVCDHPIRQHLMANRSLYELESLLTPHNHLHMPAVTYSRLYSDT
jgi:type II secretory ATPase GspE/PulE/Tfp pilus assembly ATPase PilB-like protein